MKWKHYQNGDIRTYKWFAWYPYKNVDGFTYWLETLEITESFYSGYWFPEQKNKKATYPSQ